MLHSIHSPTQSALHSVSGEVESLYKPFIQWAVFETCPFLVNIFILEHSLHLLYHSQHVSLCVVLGNMDYCIGGNKAVNVRCAIVNGTAPAIKES